MNVFYVLQIARLKTCIGHNIQETVRRGVDCLLVRDIQRHFNRTGAIDRRQPQMPAKKSFQECLFDLLRGMY